MTSLIIFLLAIGFGFGPVFAKAGAGNYIQFLAPGIIVMSVLFTSIFTGLEIIWDKQFGFLKETLVAPVSRFNIVLGRTLGGATIACLQGLIIFFLTLSFNFFASKIILPANSVLPDSLARIKTNANCDIFPLIFELLVIKKLSQASLTRLLYKLFIPTRVINFIGLLNIIEHPSHMQYSTFEYHPGPKMPLLEVFSV